MFSLPRPAWTAKALETLLDGRLACVSVRCDHVPGLEYAHELLDETELARLAELRAPLLRERFFGGRWLIRSMAGLFLDCPPAEVPLKRDARGKPHVENHEIFHFSLSHSGDWIAAAFVLGHPLGVDIEHRNRTVNLQKIAERYFSPAEQAAVREGGENAFLRIWTRKEAIVKATGSGLRMPLHLIETIDPRHAQPWALHSFTVAGQVQGTVACLPSCGPVELACIDLGHDSIVLS